jgi:hypothetical protein
MHEVLDGLHRLVRASSTVAFMVAMFVWAARNELPPQGPGRIFMWIGVTLAYLSIVLAIAAWFC